MALISVATLPLFSALHARFHGAEGTSRSGLGSVGGWGSRCVDACNALLLSLSPSLSLPFWVAGDDFFFAAGLSLAITATFAAGNTFFAVICDELGYFQEYRLPRRRAQEPSPQLVTRTLLKELVSHAVTAPPLMFLLVGPFLRLRNPAAADPASAPGFLSSWAQFAAMMVVQETLFYFGHRVLHHKFLYHWIHKQHHLYIAPRSFCGEYAHVIEDVLTGYIPFLLGAYLLRSHFHSVNILFLCRLWFVYEGHSGYCFQGSLAWRLGLTASEAAARHFAHHSRNRGNFGHIVLDYTFGTMDDWVAIGGVEGLRNKKEGARNTTVF